MAASTTIINSRRFIVKGLLECSFTPDTTEFIKEVSNLEIELWQKSPINVFLLGKGTTDESGAFVITFDVKDDTSFLKNGMIENVFAKIYYKHGIISGENPYTDEAAASNRPIKNLTLHEGITNIGTHQIEITKFEYSTGTSVDILEKPIDALASILFDIREATSQLPLPTGSRTTFRGFLGEPPYDFTIFSIISETINEGYAELSLPLFPIATKTEGQPFMINLFLNGISSKDSGQCFLKLNDGASGFYYTSITNLVINDGLLSVYSEGNFYAIAGIPTGLSAITMVAVDPTGRLVMYNASLGTWSFTSQLSFYQFEDPGKITEVFAGIYAATTASGTITEGNLGTGSLEPFSLSMQAKAFIPINIELTVQNQKISIFHGTFNNLLPGRKDLVMVETSDFPMPSDLSPTLGDIETIIGTPFSPALINFLTTKELTTLDKLKKAGPISYIDGFPSTGIPTPQVTILQAHIDLYTINENSVQNQLLISKDYDNLYKIAQTPKDIFVNEVQDAQISLYLAARIHNTTLQNQKLLTNLLSDKMKDCELENPFIPNVAGSTFADTAFSKFVNRCDCEDCTSAVSPFSYMVDLVKYGAKHIKRVRAPYYNPVNYDAFLTMMENYFFQPFGSFTIDCSTLHKEYCRMRLVTEVLEKYVATKTLSPAIALRLANDRKNFILLSYKTILTQSGTSYEELRSLISIQNDQDKRSAALNLSEKLGIPLYVPGTEVMTADRIWLTVDNLISSQKLNAENLEFIFGFRNTQRDVLTEPPASLMSQWKESYLINLWKSTDYLASAYSREDVNPSDDNTFKNDWKPIIDPDSFGRGDMTYESSAFALALWRHRKNDTDAFLSYFVSNSAILSRTSVDLEGRKLRIPGQNLSGVDFQNDEVYLQNPTNSLFEAFNILTKETIDAATDITLKQSKIDPSVIERGIFQPQGEQPVMRYDSILEAVNPTISATSLEVIITWQEAQIFNYMDISSNGFVQMISTGNPVEVFTSDAGISHVVVDANLKRVVLTLEHEPTPEFVAGNISFIYRAEVAINTTTVPDPEKICDALFEDDFDYTYLSPAPSGMDDPLSYKVWDDPVIWPTLIAGETTYYGKLKRLFEIINSGSIEEKYLDLVTNNLHTDMFGFNLLMETLISCENYLNAMYSFEELENPKRYMLASVIRNSGRQQLNRYWVQEEIKYVPDGETNPEELMLQNSLFWKPLSEPQTGIWDGSLQTIPATVGAISVSNIPIIDPELVKRQRLLISPDAKAYINLYDARKLQLDDQRRIYFEWLVPFNVDGFVQILNHINTGNKDLGYNISPYTTLNSLISDFESTNVFLQLKATQVLQEAFALTADAFSIILPVMRAYQDGNPSNRPTVAELRMVTDLLVTASKKKRLYFTIGLETGWIEQEVTGNFPDGTAVKYYNVLELQLDSVRGSVADRSEWQLTLAKWNRVPTIFPDIVPPENIKRFVQGEIVHGIWMQRKTFLDTTFNQGTQIFKKTLPVQTLFPTLQRLISALISRSSTTPNYDYYYLYFTELFAKETAGEDIRPYLNQWNIQIAEYRLLKQVYLVLENEFATDPLQLSNLLPTEYEDVINISIHVNMANALYFGYIKQEYNENIVLTGTDFQNYQPAIINFPLDIIQETTQWRSPNADKKAWKETLNTRIERKQSVQDEWRTVLEETEDITMPVMRDALIRSQQGGCESLNDTAEYLAQILFIETKDNCCMKHSRVSHAIETLQGLFFSLKTGINDTRSYLEDFILTAPNFDKEWEWLGAYATWRSAVFTYIYPENLLYPTLKRRQSPAFIELAETIQNANRFTPFNACQAAKKYQGYFEDIQNLKPICTANAKAFIFRKDPQDCCGDLNNSMEEYMTYYFAQSTLNGKAYYSEKRFYSASPDEHDFWKEIPMRENATVIGCLPLHRDDYEISSALWLFYTYKDGGGLKLGYLKKDLSIAGSDWTDEEEIELPELYEIIYNTTTETTIGGDSPFFPPLVSVTINENPILHKADELLSITVCQHSEEWDFVHFIFSYKRLNGTMRHVQIRYMAQDDFFDKAIGSIIYFDNASLPITAIRHQITTNTVNLDNLIGITVVFKNEVQAGAYGNLAGLNPVEPLKFAYENLIGAFKKTLSYDTFIVAGKGTTSETSYSEVSLTYTQNAASDIILNARQELVTGSGFEKNISSILPRFNFSPWEGGNAITVYSNNTPVGVKLVIGSGLLNLSSEAVFSLAPEKRVNVAIESGECIDNYDLRTANIKEHIKANLNAPQGNPIGTFYRTSTIKEVLDEAYYFVPMLIALDQQQRGDYSTALDWYRSVYDYTNDLAHKRKIFYGLILEQSVNNVFDRPADWLLDPLNPHLIAQTRTNAYTKYTLMNIIQCILAYGDREFTIDTVETVPTARKLYAEALNLLNLNELKVKPSQCYTKSHNCFPEAVSAPVDIYWSNSYAELQNALQSLNNVALIESASDELASILNGTGEMQAKFTAAFTYLSEIDHPETSDTVTAMINGTGQRMNDAYRYLFAELNLQPFNRTVNGHFTNTLAAMASLTPEEVMLPENVQKIEWLSAPAVNNARPLEFRFIDSLGVQLLGNNAAFNPMRPTPVTLQSNLIFANAATLYHPFLYQEDYTPFIDYAFCLPSNPVYSSLELKANLELFKIHNCRNIAGMERTLDIFAAPTDSITGVPVIGAGGNLTLPGVGSFTPSQYRFRILMERAKQLVSQAQQLESQFLSILEKEDAENYSQLRARQDLQTAKSTVKLQDMRVKQAENEKSVADLQLDKMQFVKTTYNDWIDGGLIGYEATSIAFLSASIDIATTTSIMTLSTAPLATADPRANAAAILANVIKGLDMLAGSFSSLSGLNSQLASYARRQQEWQYQSALAGYDISIANQQIKIAEQNTRIVSQEREIASMNMGHATDTLEFLKTKFTNAELYRWMGNVLERTYSYMLSLATATAKTAERQYYFEQQQQSGSFIMDDYWEVPQTGSLGLNGGGIDRRGMTGSTRLLQDITKLDQYAFDNTKRKLQMTKVISLGQLYPDAFQTFRETGILNFDLTDRLFDYDFPGHYLRLVNGVKVSVIGLLPVYDNIKATLTAGNTSYVVINANNTFQRIPIRRMETEQVALTAASRATGVFEFQQQQSELLNPFEGMGIESRWEFNMPRFSNRMAYDNIADVIIEVDYTAMDSFQYRSQVLQDIDNTLGFSRGFSMRNDYPDQWYELQEAEEGTSEFSVEIALSRDQFPQGIENIRLDGSKLLLHFVRKDGFTNEISIADFNLVGAAANNRSMGGTTVNGTFNATALTNVLSTQSPASPFVKLRLSFLNTAINREWFSQENVRDILLVVNCKADLPLYPLR